MFKKDSKPTGATPSTTETASASAEPKKTGSSVPSIISADLKIVGDLKTNGDIQVDGTVEGDINSRLLIVGAGARIEGSIKADTVRVSGAVHGQIEAKSVSLDKSAKVVGDVVHENLTMEAGAFLEGGVRRIEANTASVSPLRPSGASTGTETSNGQTTNGSYGDQNRSGTV